MGTVIKNSSVTKIDDDKSFYLISQKDEHATVSPTYYKIINEIEEDQDQHEIHQITRQLYHHQYSDERTHLGQLCNETWIRTRMGKHDLQLKC